MYLVSIRSAGSTYDFCVELMNAGGEYFVDARRIHERYESETSAHHHRHTRSVVVTHVYARDGYEKNLVNCRR